MVKKGKRLHDRFILLSGLKEIFITLLCFDTNMVRFMGYSSSSKFLKIAVGLRVSTVMRRKIK